MTSATTLVKNTGQSVESSVSNLDTVRPKRSQAFTTGDNAGGYRLSSVGINFGEIHADSQPGSELTATLNKIGADGNPGDALCTLANPGTFANSGVHHFDAPTTGDGACPRLWASTSYSLVVERANNTSQTISLRKTVDDAEDDLEPATGWTVADDRRDFDQSQTAWSLNNSALMIEVHGTTLAEQPDEAPTGAPAITGTAMANEILTVGTSAIADGDGLDGVEFTYQWVRTSGGGADTDIPNATLQTYTLTAAEVGSTIKVKVSFRDDEGHSYTLTSPASDPVAAASPGLVVVRDLTVGEDSTSTYTVKLATAPASNVVIDVAKLGGSSDVSVSPARLTFTPSDWSEPQDVMVTAADDADSADDLAVITHTVNAASSEDSYDDMAAVAVVVTVAENDTVKLVGNRDGFASDAVIGFGGGELYAQVFRTGPDPSNYRIASASLWFGEYSGLADGEISTLAVEVSIAEVVQYTRPATEDFVVAPLITTSAPGRAPGDVVCTLVSPVSYVENGENVFVAPDSCPTLAPDTRYSIVANLLSTSNHQLPLQGWNHDLRPFVDADSFAGWQMDRDCIYLYTQPDPGIWGTCGTFTSFGYVLRGGVVAVPDVVVSPPSVEITEFGEGSFSVALATVPAADVTVDLSAGGNLTVSPSSLTFTADNGDTPQTVTVSALNFDLSTVPSPTETVSLGVAAGSSPEYLHGAAASVEVTVVAGVPGVTVSETVLSVPENGSGTYTVALDARPSASVTVNVVVSGGTVTVSPSSLTFSATDWQSPKTVEVSAADDDDLLYGLATVSHTVDHGTATEYSTETADDVAITVIDDDASTLLASTGQARQDAFFFSFIERRIAQPFVTGPNSGGYDLASGGIAIRFYDSGSAGQITAVIKTAVADVTLGHVPGETVCTLTGPARWKTGVVNRFIATDTCHLAADTTYFFELQRSHDNDEWIRLWSVESLDIDEVSAPGWSIPDKFLSMDRTETSYERRTVAAHLEITAATLPDVVVSVSELSVVEESQGIYTVKLGLAPAFDVVIDVALSGDSDASVTVSPAQLTFTSMNWSMDQTVTVYAAGDDDSADDLATVTHTVDNANSDDGYDDVPIDSVKVTVDDNTAAGLTLSPASLLFASEGLAGVSYMVGLASQPSGDVTVDITVPGLASFESVTVSPLSLTFTADDWSTAQTVSVSSPADDNAADIAATIHHEVAAGSAGEYAGVTADLPVSVADDLSLLLPLHVLDGASVLEGGTTEFTVDLPAVPTADVTVDVAVSGGLTVSSDGVLFGSSASVTFTPLDWSTAKTVSVAAAQDANTVHETVSVSVSVAAGSAAEYVSKALPSALSVVVADDDTSAGVTVAPVSLEVDEGGTGTYTVVLDALPSAPVAVSVSSGDGSAAAVDTAQLVFDTSNWGTPQSVTVTGVADLADSTVTVAHAVLAEYDGGAKHSAPEYVALASVDSVTVSVVDDDDYPGVTVSETALTVGEQDATGGSYWVVLDTEPSADVTVTVGGFSGTDVTVSPTSVVFTGLDWETARTVTVTAGDDLDVTDDTVALTHSAMSSDSDYGAVSIAGVTVTVADNDTARVSGVSVASGDAQLVVGWTAVGNATGYRVQWKSGGQSFNTTDREAAVGSGPPTSYTIPGLANGTEYSVRVIATRTGANDGAASAEVNGIPAAAGVTVSETALTVGEGASATYTVKLTSEPTSDVVIDVAVSGDSDVSVLPASLRFTDMNWATEQTVTVSAAGDADKTDDAATVTHTVNNGLSDDAYDGLSIRSVTVTVDDNTNSPATGAPTISGTAQVNEELTASASGIVDADGLVGVEFSYQWIRTSGGVDADIPNAVLPSYTLVPADEGATVKVRVSFVDQAGHSELRISAATDPVRAADDPGLGATNVQVTKGSGPTATTVVSETNGYVQARVRLAWSAPVAQAGDVVGYLVERRAHHCYADPAGVDRLTFWTKVHEWDFEQAAERHAGEEFSVSPSQLSFVDLGSPQTYVRDDGTVYTTRPSGVRLSSAEAGDDASVTIRQEYRIVTIRRNADPVYSTSVLVGYDHAATANNRITVTPQPTEFTEPNCIGTAPAITLGDIAVTAIGSTAATITVSIQNADNTLVYFGYATNTDGWQYRYVQVSSSTAQVTLTGLVPGTRYYVQASLDPGFDYGRNRVTTFDTQSDNTQTVGALPSGRV